MSRRDGPICLPHLPKARDILPDSFFFRRCNTNLSCKPHMWRHLASIILTRHLHVLIWELPGTVDIVQCQVFFVRTDNTT